MMLMDQLLVNTSSHTTGTVGDCAGGEVLVNDSAVLAHYLCRGHLKSSTTLIITPTVLNIDAGFEEFCIVQDIVDVIIAAAQLPVPVMLKCRQGTGGFGFFNTTNLTLKGLTFIDCGTAIKLPQSVQPYTNDSTLFIGPGQKSVLLFSRCRYTVASHIDIGGSYRGFGILAINTLIWFELSNCTVTNANGNTMKPSPCNPLSTNDYSCSGSGLVFVYVDDNDTNSIGPPVDNDTLALQNVNIHNTSMHYAFEKNLLDIYFNSNNYNPILSGTGVSMLFSSNSHLVVTVINELRVSGTRASHAGAVLFYFLKTNIMHPIWINCIQLEHNSVLLHEYSLSPGLTMLFSTKFQEFGLSSKKWSPFGILNGYFAYNTGYKGAGMLMKAQAFSRLHTLIQLYSCTFFRNQAAITGSAFHVETSVMKKVLQVLSIILDKANATENSDKNGTYGASVLSFISPGAAIKFTSGTLLRNKGSAIEVYSSTLKLGDKFHCEENISFKGSCVFMRGTSFIEFHGNISVYMRSNLAHLSGGAIYSDDAGGPSDTCSIVLDGKPLLFIAEGNKASLDGDVMRLSNLYNCSIYVIYKKVLLLKNNLEFFMNYLNYHPNSTRDIVSRVNRLIVCNSTQSYVKFVIYSGMIIHLPVKAVDAGSHPVYTSATLTLHPHNHHDNWTLQGINFYNLYTDTCNHLSFLIVTRSLSTNSSGYVVLQSTDSSTASVQFQLTFLPCPYGFAGTSSSTGKCGCSLFLRSLHADVSCEIQSGSIILPSSAWFDKKGKGNSSLDAFSYSCPIGYCNSNNFKVSIDSSLCTKGRTGVMCGKCKEGLSVVFGSDNKCYKCSNYYLLLLLAFVLAGVVLVFLLFAVNIEISGGVVGSIIFYANMSSISLHTAMLNNQPYTVPVKMVLSFLNLNVGFTVCFYDGMTNTAKAAMQFIFPVYLCTIVLVLVILSRYSYRIANMIIGSSVQVLSTIVHLSFAKLLSTSAVILTSSELILSGVNPHQLVWYYDGTVEYFTGFHVVLVIVSLLVIILVIFPYLVFTVIASHLRRYPRISLYLHPLIDAYHSPYKVKYGYWFGVRQCLMVTLYVMYSVLRGTRPSIMLMVNIVCIGIFMIIQVMVKPFKNTIVSYLDAWFMCLLWCTDLVAFFFLRGTQIQATTQSSFTGVFLLMLYLLSVLVLFMCQVLRLCKFHLVLYSVSRKFFQRCFDSDQKLNIVVDDEIREPLLSDY